MPIVAVVREGNRHAFRAVACGSADFVAPLIVHEHGRIESEAFLLQILEMVDHAAFEADDIGLVQSFLQPQVIDGTVGNNLPHSRLDRRRFRSAGRGKTLPG